MQILAQDAGALHQRDRDSPREAQPISRASAARPRWGSRMRAAIGTDPRSSARLGFAPGTTPIVSPAPSFRARLQRERFRRWQHACGNPGFARPSAMR
jgi:hypothetical protein